MACSGAHLDHFKDGCAGSSAEVDGHTANVWRAEQLVQRRHMALHPRQDPGFDENLYLSYP